MPEKLQSNRRELARQLDVIETSETSNLPLLSTVMRLGRDKERHGAQQRNSLTEVSFIFQLLSCNFTALILEYGLVKTVVNVVKFLLIPRLRSSLSATSRLLPHYAVSTVLLAKFIGLSWMRNSLPGPEPGQTTATCGRFLKTHE